ncbi:hypothetical protein ACFL4E_02260 [Candidatus Omnitrophota bacterium]
MITFEGGDGTSIEKAIVVKGVEGGYHIAEAVAKKHAANMCRREMPDWQVIDIHQNITYNEKPCYYVVCITSNDPDDEIKSFIYDITDAIFPPGRRSK